MISTCNKSQSRTANPRMSLVLSLLLTFIMAFCMVPSAPAYADNASGTLYKTKASEVVWNGKQYSYYQGFQGAFTLAFDSSRTFMREYYGIWMDDPNGGTAIDDKILTDWSKYREGSIDIAAYEAAGGKEGTVWTPPADGSLTRAQLWDRVHTPSYFYNVITQPYNSADTISFKWERQGPGGNHAANMFEFANIYESLDANGLGAGTPVAEAASVGTQNTGVNAGNAVHFLNWVSAFQWDIPANTLQPNKTYYLVLEQGNGMGNGDSTCRLLNCNIVFEFSTNMQQAPISYPSGQDVVKTYGGHQGNNGAIDILSPSSDGIVTNVTKSINCYVNTLSKKYNPSTPFTFLLTGNQSAGITAVASVYKASGVTLNGSGVSYDASSKVADLSTTVLGGSASGTNMAYTSVATSRGIEFSIDLSEANLDENQDYYLVLDKTTSMSGRTIGNDILIGFTMNGPAEPAAMFRLYNPNSGEHFYTQDANEHNVLVSLGWQDEGVGWTAPSTSSTPVYRVYNPNAGDHHYTMDENEYRTLISIGWNDEGIGWYSDDDQGVPLYRQYNPNAVAGAHNYTTDLNEHQTLTSIGWNDEGVAWYGLAS